MRPVEQVDFPKRVLANISETKGRKASRFAALDAELNCKERFDKIKSLARTVFEIKIQNCSSNVGKVRYDCTS
jgi:hypothetical protein